MQTIQIVLDEPLLRAADRAARRTHKNRSALIRDALRQHLKQLQILELEKRDRDGYGKNPPPTDESWERGAPWPKD
ncbi:MAG: ribbon-helix-helix domain-containing protein [Bryobacteraceae bacterium]